MTHYSFNKHTMREGRVAIRQWRVNTSCRVILLIILSTLTAVYIGQTTTASTSGYDMQEVQKNITELQRENQRLEFAIATNGSMQKIQARLPDNHFVAVGTDVEYVTRVSAVVARR